jgi:hypothetical protein
MKISLNEIIDAVYKSDLSVDRELFTEALRHGYTHKDVLDVLSQKDSKKENSSDQ